MIFIFGKNDTGGMYNKSGKIATNDLFERRV